MAIFKGKLQRSGWTLKSTGSKEKMPSRLGVGWEERTRRRWLAVVKEKMGYVASLRAPPMEKNVLEQPACSKSEKELRWCCYDHL